MANGKKVPALKVHQWLRTWDKVAFDKKERRTKPVENFLLFSIPAAELRSLCGISRRSVQGIQRRTDDLGIQRQHDPDRSAEIQKFVEHGYPWSTLSDAKRRAKDFSDLKKPGWLPTAIIINILGKSAIRDGVEIADKDLVTIADNGDSAELILPYQKWTKDWETSSIPPFEVIDGQHRLWAFDDKETKAGSFDLPVVAFQNLDISWQAYLFWTVNIKPKRINPSLAFDLYPLLRAEDWLERADEHIVYRETRAQELAEALWAYPTSPWYDRINMLGEPKNPWVTQAAWIRNIAASFVKPWEARQNRTGGLFGERIGQAGEVLGWSRAQQAALLIFAWNAFRTAVHETNSSWAKSLRSETGKPANKIRLEDEPAFYDPHSLIVTDQGVRGFLQIVNDVCYTLAPRLKLNKWPTTAVAGALEDKAIEAALKSLRNEPVAKTLEEIAKQLATFDWRTSAAKDLTEEQRVAKLGLRGGSGYKEIRRQLIAHIAKAPGEVGAAGTALKAQVTGR